MVFQDTLDYLSNNNILLFLLLLFVYVSLNYIYIHDKYILLFSNIKRVDVNFYNYIAPIF